MKLLWNDEFDGTEIDSSNVASISATLLTPPDDKTFIGGWGNKELDSTTPTARERFVKDGLLHSRAITENFDRSIATRPPAQLKTQKTDKSRSSITPYGRSSSRANCPSAGRLGPRSGCCRKTQVRRRRPRRARSTSWKSAGQTPKEILGTLHYGGRLAR